MFERWTERARQVVVLAQEEARLLSHTEISSWHLLVGLIRESEGLAARALKEVDIDLQTFPWEQIPGKPAAEPVTGQVPFTEDAKDSMKYALREALGLGHNYIGTEHVLLGILRQGDITFLDADKLRKIVFQILAPPRPRSEAKPGNKEDVPIQAYIALVERSLDVVHDALEVLYAKVQADAK